MNLTESEIKQNIGEFSAILSQCDSGVIERFFGELFTQAERADIATRWALLKALNRKLPQRKIAKELGISLCRITRGSKELKKPNSTLAKMLQTHEL
jgi:TrpR family trp operon transcriptional repressor